jgi:CDP-diglyceride synthetase
MNGAILFGVSLKRGLVKYQMRRLAWTAIVLVFVFACSFIQIYNLYKGCYWVIFPILCIPINSFFCMWTGTIWGKTPLNKYLPSKTLEGYVGGLLCTAICAYFVISLYISS